MQDPILWVCSETEILYLTCGRKNLIHNSFKNKRKFGKERGNRETENRPDFEINLSKQMKYLYNKKD